MEAYVLINTDPGSLWDVAEKAAKIPGVKMAHPVTGQFDIVAYAEFARIDDLRNIIGRFQSLDGVVRTHTCIAIPVRLSEDFPKTGNP